MIHRNDGSDVIDINRFIHEGVRSNNPLITAPLVPHPSSQRYVPTGTRSAGNKLSHLQFSEKLFIAQGETMLLRVHYFPLLTPFFPCYPYHK